MSEAPALVVVLADSTGYGWLRDAQVGGAGLVFRDKTVAAIVSGGSLVKAGPAGPPAVDLLMKEWVLQGGRERLPAEAPVEVGFVPSKCSVPNREFPESPDRHLECPS